MTPTVAPTTPNVQTIKASRLKVHKPPKGDSFVDQSERAVHVAGDKISSAYTALSTFVGERPYGTSKVSERKQVQTYALVRNNPQAWTELITNYGLKQTIDYALRLEKMVKRYPEELAYVNDPEPIDMEAQA